MEKNLKMEKLWEDMLAKKPFIISGPCSIESESQVVATATQLSKTGKVDLLRAGVWKPRTKPGNFEGIGVKGFPWLQKAKHITGLPFSVEVATGKHVEQALKYGTDVLWIGARTTVNPFSMQEIADSLKGVDVPVLIKNPISPDLQLWIGGIERIRQAGIQRIGLIHRGFASFGNVEYRNAPMWHIPIELKRAFPELPMICDPSHIGGSRDKILEISQKAADLNYDGLMIESHIDPDKAWSDAQQQITPHQLEEVLDQIIWRSENYEKESYSNELSQLREQINQIDDEIMTLLSRRMNIAESIGVYKKANNMTILQTKRWGEIVDQTIQKGEKLGLTASFVTGYLNAVHVESITHQNKVMNRRVEE